jgi:hypothetical protein
MTLSMRNFVCSAGLAILLLSSSVSWGQNAPNAPKPNDPSLAAASEVGKAVQDALYKANATGLGGLRLTKAVLSLETGSTTEGGLKLNFIIFTISHTAKKGDTVTQTITFGALDKAHAAGKPDFSALTDSLSQAVATSATTAAEVQVLPLSQATVKVEFAVERKNDGGLSFKVLGYDVSGSIDWDKTSKNSLEVTFTK